jgi:hypothetical protein
MGVTLPERVEDRVERDQRQRRREHLDDQQPVEQAVLAA